MEESSVEEYRTLLRLCSKKMMGDRERKTLRIFLPSTDGSDNSAKLSMGFCVNNRKLNGGFRYNESSMKNQHDHVPFPIAASSISAISRRMTGFFTKDYHEGEKKKRRVEGEASPHVDDSILREFFPLEQWSQLASNPLNGLMSIFNETKENSGPNDGEAGGQEKQPDAFCDVCQKGFFNTESESAETKFNEHCKDKHLQCSVPGCGFVCKKGLLTHTSEQDGAPVEHYKGEWKLQIHFQTMHAGGNHEVDTSAYLKQRKSRFPTSSKIQKNVEELIVKAANGEVLSEERKRWLTNKGSNDATPHAMKTTTAFAGSEECPPNYYVCTKCGDKGSHWSAGCPRLKVDAQKSHKRSVDCEEDVLIEVPASREPVSIDVTPTDLSFSTKASQLNSTDAVSAQAGKNMQKHTQKLLKDAKLGRQVEAKMTTQEKTPSLFNRLSADQALVNHGLLLQSFRYFVLSDFFGDEELA